MSTWHFVETCDGWAVTAPGPGDGIDSLCRIPAGEHCPACRYETDFTVHCGPCHKGWGDGPSCCYAHRASGAARRCDGDRDLFGEDLYSSGRFDDLGRPE